MAKRELYSIGEISELSDTSTKMLRHYDELGILKPEYKDPNTLYRYYTRDQVFDVFLIKKLQALGFSLKEIGILLARNQPELYTREIARKMEELRGRIDQLERTYVEGIMLLDKLEMREARTDYFHSREEDAFPVDSQLLQGAVRREYIPEVRALYTKRTMTDYNNVEISIKRWFELFKLAKKRALPVTGSITLTYHTEHPMEQFFKSTCELEVLLPVGENGRQYGDIKPFGGFEAAAALHMGGYDTISATHLKVLRWMEQNHLEVGGKVSEEYVISPIDLKIPSGYITKIIVPIK